MNDEDLNIRVPTGTRSRVEALIPYAGRLPEVRKVAEAAEEIGAYPPRMNRSQIARLALVRGLVEIETLLGLVDAEKGAGDAR